MSQQTSSLKQLKAKIVKSVVAVVFQLLSHVWLFATPWTATHQAPLSSTISWSLLKFLSIELVMLSIHLILCHPLFLFPSGFFPMSQLFPSGGQSIRASATVLPMNIQGWFPLELTGLISLHSKGLPRVFSSTTVWKHQFFGTQPSSSSVLGGFITSLSYKSPFTMTRLWSMKGIFIYTWYLNPLYSVSLRYLSKLCLNASKDLELITSQSYKVLIDWYENFSLCCQSMSPSNL